MEQEIEIAEKMQVMSTREKMKLFLEATGDMNPAHHDLEYCLKNGLKDIVVPGMFNASRLYNHVQASNKVRFNFNELVFPEDELALSLLNDNFDAKFINQNHQIVSELYNHFFSGKVFASVLRLKGREPEIDKLVTEDNLHKFKISTDIMDDVKALRMYSVSLIPAALTSHYCSDGIYRAQKIIFHSEFQIGDRLRIYSQITAKTRDSENGFLYNMLNYCFAGGNNKRLIYKGLATCACNKDM